MRRRKTWTGTAGDCGPARQDRLELLSRTTGRLLARLDAAAARANTKVLLHPGRARAVVQTSN